MLSRRIFKELMALPTWKCLDCEKEFRAGSWQCLSGAGHRVATKRYYMNDAPTVVTLVNGRATVNKRDSQTMVMNIPPEERTTGPDGNERVIPGGQVVFIRGMYETDDPIKQFWLDKHRGMCSEAEWQAAYLNEDEKMALREMDLAAREARLEHDRNSLLEQVQKRA
jgi:hypothetical protein